MQRCSGAVVQLCSGAVEEYLLSNNIKPTFEAFTSRPPSKSSHQLSQVISAVREAQVESCHKNVQVKSNQFNHDLPVIMKSLTKQLGARQKINFWSDPGVMKGMEVPNGT